MKSLLRSASETNVGIGFTKALQQTKESFMNGNAAEEVKETTKTFQTPSHGTPMVQPSGILTSIETMAGGKRYADRPEGIDQFGGEEFERDVYGGDATKGMAASLRQYNNQSAGLDQFGGEGMEREVIETREWEKKSSHSVNVQPFPQGADELGGMDDSSTS